MAETGDISPRFPRSSAFAALMWLALGASARADEGERPEPMRIPKVGCPEEHFYNAAGINVKLKATASPVELATDEKLTYTLTITNLLNAPDVEKPSLKKLKDFDLFQIEEGPDLDPPVNREVRNVRVFKYRLRPSSEAVTLVPEVPFHYFDPKLSFDPETPRQRFPRRYSNAIPIRVKPPAAKPQAAEAIPLDVPAFAQDLSTSDSLMSPSSSSVPGWGWALALVAPPLLAVGWLLAWRRLYPNAARLAQLKRNKAVRQALAALATARRRRPDDAAGVIAEIFTGYLQERFELPFFARTPREVAEHLGSINLPPERVEAVAVFFRSCDAARFAPARAAAPELANEAELLIVALEGPA